jgi:RNA polymerase sigma factor (sigma-70 family)
LNGSRPRVVARHEQDEHSAQGSLGGEWPGHKSESASGDAWDRINPTINDSHLWRVGKAMDRSADSAFAASLPPAEGERLDAKDGMGFEDLFASEHERLFRAVYLVTGSSQEAEELMQDAFLKVWERWDRVSRLDNPGGYLYRVAINGARSRYRRAALAAKRTLSFGQAEDQFAAADLRDELVRALKMLTPRQRMALVLRDLVGLSSEEAGEVLGVTPGTVRALASHARVALKLRMEDDDD